jgi:aryl-alcohol dehydrogenase-like predicted oxidoreductase
MNSSPIPFCRLALGTAQFGLNYGITNSTGRISETTAREILSVAERHSIEYLDTASGYGDSEATIGRLKNFGDNILIYTKTPNWNGLPNENCAKEVADSFQASQEKLNQEQLGGLMVHYAPDLLSRYGQDIWTAIQTIKGCGHVSQIGISVYADDPIDELARKFNPDFIQLPISVFDQRLVANGQLERLRSAGIKVHARSVFMQGIALIDVKNLPTHLQGLSSSLQTFKDICDEYSYTQLEGALSFVRSIKELSSVVIGVTSPHELEAVCKAFYARTEAIDWKPVGSSNSELTDPRHWPTA